MRPRRIFASLFLAALTTLAVSWSLARWLPIQYGRGTVSLDGDHLQPWILEVHRPGASRFIYFEKGRVYNTQGIGTPMSSSAAVACWSFATSTRTNSHFQRATLAVPPHLEAEMAKTPRAAWGIAEDRRGWPLPAFACTYVGTTSPGGETYDVRDGIRIDPSPAAPDPLFSGYVRAGQRVESLADIRAFPLRPLWPGLLANTALAAITWFLILTASTHLIAAAKSRLRQPAGHCPKCDYDLRGDFATGCPECGWNRAPLTERNR